MNIASNIFTVLAKYSITHRMGLFCADNADNNDTTVEELQKLIPGLDSTSRLRCVGHIINLICKALILGQGVSKFERELAGASDHEIFELWRSRGVIGRVHNIVKYIRRSQLRVDEFSAIQKSNLDDDLFYYSALMLIKDGGGKSFHR
jgi:hypothetical protein